MPARTEHDFVPQNARGTARRRRTAERTDVRSEATPRRFPRQTVAYDPLNATPRAASMTGSKKSIFTLAGYRSPRVGMIPCMEMM